MNALVARQQVDDFRAAIASADDVWHPEGHVPTHNLLRIARETAEQTQSNVPHFGVPGRGYEIAYDTPSNFINGVTGEDT
jgi:hypothetical protein